MTDHFAITFLSIMLGVTLADHKYDLAAILTFALVAYLYYAWKGHKEHKKAIDYFFE